MSNMNQSLRVLAILADADHDTFLAGATAASCPAEGVEITLISPDPAHPDVDQAMSNGPARWSSPHDSGRGGVTMQTSVRSQPVTELIGRASSREPEQPVDARSQSTVERLIVDGEAIS